MFVFQSLTLQLFSFYFLLFPFKHSLLWPSRAKMVLCHACPMSCFSKIWLLIDSLCREFLVCPTLSTLYCLFHVQILLLYNDQHTECFWRADFHPTVFLDCFVLSSTKSELISSVHPDVVSLIWIFIAFSLCLCHILWHNYPFALCSL